MPKTSLSVAQDLGLPANERIGQKMLIGRREWFTLPELGVDVVAAKVDTGAYTSSLHAEEIQPFDQDGEPWVGFTTYSYHGVGIRCEAPLVQKKKIKSSNGNAKKRLIIKSRVQLIGGFEWEVLFSLADRSVMKCPLLIGRRALSGYFVVDTQVSYLFGKINRLTDKSQNQSP